jgi:transcriptional regulator with XRE-family HTH domain
VAKKTPETVGQRIKRYREEKGISTNALAVETGIAKSYLWSLEKDATATRPSAESLYKIAKALGVTMSALLGRELLSDPPQGVPPGLAEFATENGLPDSDVQMLAGIQFRGERPQTKERWAYIYNAIRMSRGMDDSGGQPA